MFVAGLFASFESESISRNKIQWTLLGWDGLKEILDFVNNKK